MSEKLFQKQNIVAVETSDLLATVKDLKEEGYRLLQICATKVENGIEILYSFDKEHELFNYRLTISEEENVESITSAYWNAFIYENEMHDLFGVKIRHSALDYGGKFFKVAEETPWNPKN